MALDRREFAKASREENGWFLNGNYIQQLTK